MRRLFLFLFPMFPAGREGTALFLLRVFIGIAFLFHGFGKVKDLSAFATEFQLPFGIAAMAAYVQFFGAFLMIIGLLTPLVSMSLAGTMAVATFTLIAKGESFVDPHAHTWEASSFYLVTCLAVALLGPGIFSTDALLFCLLSGRRLKPLSKWRLKSRSERIANTELSHY